MFLTRKHLSRRAVLRGAGVAVALPLLDAMIPAATALAKTAAQPKTRVGFFYMPHGAVLGNTAFGPAMDRWTPSGSGDAFKLSPILSPLEKHKRYLAAFTNLENKASDGSVHVINPATWLSATRPNTDSAGASMATTIDQLIAAKIGQDTTLPSMEVASETTLQTAACGGGTGRCFYSSTTSFRNPSTPLPMEYNPRKVFTQLFGEGDTAEERTLLNHQTASILDLISERTQSLQRDLGASDKVILGNYLENIREIERRVEKSQAKDLSTIKVPKAPVGELDNFDAQVKLMFELVGLAYQGDLTRVISYIMVSEGTNRTYNHIGVPDAFHPVSHHANDPERLEKLVKIQRWHMERFAEFIARMADTPDGDGSMLDHALFMYGSNMSNSDRHSNYPLPNLLIGGANGRLKGGQAVQLPERTPHANLLLTVLNKVGVEQESFADSTGLIREV
jgi:hypothetical protein